MSARYNSFGPLYMHTVYADEREGPEVILKTTRSVERQHNDVASLPCCAPTSIPEIAGDTV